MRLASFLFINFQFRFNLARSREFAITLRLGLGKNTVMG
jgi:hypothetical protein